MLTVDALKLTRRSEVTPQGALCAVVPNRKGDSRVADVVTNSALLVTLDEQVIQRAEETIWIFDREEVLAQGEHRVGE